MTLRRTPFLIAVATLLLLAAGSRADEDVLELRSFTLQVDPPRIEIASEDDGLAELRIRGYHSLSAAPGSPDVPIRTVRVAIPPGATPRLSVTRGRTSFSAVVPRPVPRIGYERLDSTRVRAGGDEALLELSSLDRRPIYEPRADSYRGEGTQPARAAWLGRTGVLRDQHYVDVHLAPVRYDRARGGLIVESGLEVTVHFEGDFDVARGGPVRQDHLESVYRETFANYGQGRFFRASAVRPFDATPPKAKAAAGSPDGPIRRVRIRSNGPVRLDYALFSTQAPEFLSTDPREWRLSNQGEQVPLHIEQGGIDDSLLESGEWVQFYGQALDDEPATVPNLVDLQNPLLELDDVADFTDENAYFLSVDIGAQPTMTEREAAPAGGTPEAHFTALTHREIEVEFTPLQEELWFWSLVQETGSITQSVPLTGLADGTLPARIRVGLRGFPFDCAGVDPDHKSLVSLENDLAQTLELPAGNPDNVGNENVGEFDGNSYFVHDFDWTHFGADPLMTNPLKVTLAAAELDIPCPNPPPDNVLNDLLLDFIEVEYEREFTASFDRLIFEFPDGDALFEVIGFTNNAIDVYEITGEIGDSGVVDTVRLTGLTPTFGGSLWDISFRMDNDPGLADGTPRRFLVQGRGGVPVPSPQDFVADRVSTLISDTTQAELIVIAHPDLLHSECTESVGACDYDVDCTASPTDRCELILGSPLDNLLAHRALEGIDARVARVQDVEDEFNHGLAGPWAIKNFVEWVLSGGWSGDPPSYVMLLGDGSYHYKNGTNNGNFVPTQIVVNREQILSYFATDSRLAAVLGDDFLADAVVGRITARLRDEADDILEKILAYGQDTSPGAWRGQVLFISDRGKGNNVPEADGFEAMNALGEEMLAGTNYTSTNLRYWTDYCQGPGNCDWDTMNADILSAFFDGVAMAQFTGHGNFDVWSDDVIFCGNDANGHPRCDQDDTTLLDNTNKLPLLLVHNCLTAGFHSTGLKSMGEQWLKQPITEGGAAAVYAPSGLGFRFIGLDVTEVFWSDVFEEKKERQLGVPVMNAQIELCDGNPEACQFYVLLGDPSSRISGLPDVKPATTLVATPSTGRVASVQLDWSASATPGVTYDVYRKRVGALAYQKANTQAPVNGTQFIDDDENEVIHTETYRYYVVAVQDGFASAWSNFNSDCEPVPGPDCIEATPLNFTPPDVPTGLTVADVESGGKLMVSWNAIVNEPDIANYTVHYGTTPALGQTKVSFETSTTLSGLTNGVDHYVAIQATNTTGVSSLVSDQVIGRPNLVLGVRAPDWIDDLRLAKAGDDVLLTWGAVQLDIYGKPIAVAEYEIYRGDTAQFVPSPGDLLNPQPVVPSFTDTGALVGAQPYFYLVRANDGGGNPGGLGGQLPSGIVDLVIDKSQMTPGAIVLSWPPVTTDFDGNPSSISHYEIWADDVPFSRANIEAGSPELLVPVVPATFFEILPTGEERYYSVLPVDARGNRSSF